MTAMAIKYFDTLAYVKESKRLGVPEELAEYQVSEYEKALEVAVDNMRDEIKSDDLATKKDLLLLNKDLVLLKNDLNNFESKFDLRLELLETKLQKEIAHSGNRLIIWVVGILIANGLVQHFT